MGEDQCANEPANEPEPLNKATVRFCIEVHDVCEFLVQQFRPFRSDENRNKEQEIRWIDDLRVCLYYSVYLVEHCLFCL